MGINNPLFYFMNTLKEHLEISIKYTNKVIEDIEKNPEYCKQIPCLRHSVEQTGQRLKEINNLNKK
jgi:hypothetical protein